LQPNKATRKSIYACDKKSPGNHGKYWRFFQDFGQIEVDQSGESGITCVCFITFRRAHMSALSTLKLVAAKKPQHLPTIQLRRNKLSNKLWEQIQLAKSQLTGQPFVVTRFRSVKDRDTGLRRQVEMPKRIRPWWFITENGKVCVSVRYGSWTIELAKGKPSVEVASADELVVALETIKQAVGAGELDAQIEIASAGLKSGFKR
jgi:hypothetical protein